MSILSGLDDLGLGGLEGLDIFAEEEKKAKQTNDAEPAKIEEKDLIYDKTFTCPVCDSEFTSKIMKTGKARMMGTDNDLRAKYEGIDPVKYDVEMCPVCGYAALNRFFPHITSSQVKLIQGKVSMNVHIKQYTEEVYTYERALERYKLALVCAVVKRGKASEKAYICLKSAWLMRGWQENLQAAGNADEKMLAELAKQEDEYLQNAYKGFAEARKSEGFPMCGMDEQTVDYLLAVLAARFGQYEMAGRLVTAILSNSSASARVKEKTRTLRNEIVQKLKQK